MQEEDFKELNFEKGMSKLEGIVKKLESNELSLEDSLKVFEKGIELKRFCMRHLDLAEKKIMELKENEKKELHLTDWNEYK
jgi:exodeoxyribonuclease VII small subunit